MPLGFITRKSHFLSRIFLFHKLERLADLNATFCVFLTDGAVTLQGKWCSFLQDNCGLHDKWCNMQEYGMSPKPIPAAWSPEAAISLAPFGAYD